MRELIAKWRREANRLGQRSYRTITYRECARELERAWHDFAHGSAWESDGSCPVCIEEMNESAS